jgi:zinc protease
MPIESLDLLIQVEAHRMRNINLDKQAFESERNVVLEERKMRYENSSRGKLYLKTLEAFFEGTPYGRSVIGDIEDLNSVQTEQIQAYFDQFYAPNNAILVIAGDIDYDKTEKWIREAFGPLKKSEELEKLKQTALGQNFKIANDKGHRVLSFHAETNNPQFMLAFPGEKIGTRRAYELDLLEAILSSGKSSYLNQKYIQVAKPLLTYIGGSNYNLMQSGIFFISGEILPGVSIKKVEQMLKRDLKLACNPNVINKRSIQKVLNQYLVSFYSELETNSGLASILGDHQMYYGTHDNYKKMLDIFSSITEEEVLQACQKLFSSSHSLFVSVWNKHKK